MTLTDCYQLSRACLKGCADELHDSAHATCAIVSLLQADLNEEIELNGFHRDGLLTALNLLADSLSSRSSFALGRLDKEFGDD
ncbi:hypothetical protein [Kushneria phosphatilytica]|uniref:Uncharacterized protein n=1 Tax=Kushneria phosphatilytica TaxID=657387 RepID=A0A1S1NQV4_9GAMM|nr:hypothetical protein [Kushneria phosphatilytica]OHV07482.1 hypothetical protein BH688_14685 [Kushneria phosphatilytica]QEL09963.1 hypothetical protein FY550_01655 [Kushneria phosphatilytica]